MKKSKKKLLYHIVNVVSIAMIVESFLISMVLVKNHAQKDCFDRIEETTQQISTMFVHAMDDRRQKLTALADILGANSENPDALLQTHMETFCKTQSFSALCIHRANGTKVYYGDHPHNDVRRDSFAEEIQRLPYVSEVYSSGNDAKGSYIYQAVPIVREEKTVAILYGYTSLDVLPSFIVSSSYDGRCQFYIVDGDSGNFLMDEYHGTLGNIFDGSMGNRETKDGYDIQNMCDDIKTGKSGFLVFLSQRTGQWYYTYYMPMGINNWSIQLTIDEPTAFASFNSISQMMMFLMILVICLVVILVASLMAEHAKVNRKDKAQLHKSNFISSIQHSLLNAYTHPEAVNKALQTIAEEVAAETVLLLSYKENHIVGVQYWPSVDKPQAQSLIGSNIREEFPILYDSICTGSSYCYDAGDLRCMVSQGALETFRALGIHRMLLVPILDPAGGLKGAIAAVNTPKNTTAEIIESVVYDFFIAISNLESHSIIKTMGTFDYLTGIKNRNSFETESEVFPIMEGQSLWCAYIDANGLHELNNEKGHKAGDRMLQTIAESMKRIFGAELTYRLGGDEFIAFKVNSSHEEFLQYKHRLQDELAKKGYSVSVGFEGAIRNQNGVFDVEKLIGEAERLMYRNKQRYYDQNGLEDSRCHPQA